MTYSSREQVRTMSDCNRTIVAGKQTITTGQQSITSLHGFIFVAFGIPCHRPHRCSTVDELHARLPSQRHG